jgi:hypothetical protein
MELPTLARVVVDEEWPWPAGSALRWIFHVATDRKDLSAA